MSTEATSDNSSRSNTPHELRLRIVRTGTMSASFLQRMEKYGATADLVRGLRLHVRDENSLSTQTENLHNKLNESHGGAFTTSSSNKANKESDQLDDLAALARTDDYDASKLAYSLPVAAAAAAAAEPYQPEEASLTPTSDDEHNLQTASQIEQAGQLADRLALALSRDLTSQEKRAIRTFREAGFTVELISDTSDILQPAYRDALAHIIAGNPEEGVRLIEEIAENESKTGHSPSLRLIKPRPSQAS